MCEKPKNCFFYTSHLKTVSDSIHNKQKPKSTNMVCRCESSLKFKIQKIKCALTLTNYYINCLTHHILLLLFTFVCTYFQLPYNQPHNNISYLIAGLLLSVLLTKMAIKGGCQQSLCPYINIYTLHFCFASHNDTKHFN